MIEDYGTLSQEELREEILQELEENAELDTSELKLKFEGKKLFIIGALQNEEELENLVGVLENYMEPDDFELDIDLVEGHGASDFEGGEESEAASKPVENDLEEIDDEMDFVDEEEDIDEEW